MARMGVMMLWIMGRSATYRGREWPSKCNESYLNARDIHPGLWYHNTALSSEIKLRSTAVQVATI